MKPTLQKHNSMTEFVIVISLMMSITALSTDAMLPALPQIGTQLGVQDDNTRQLVVSVIFWGMAFGQLIFGPLSDKTGRKPAISLGYLLFLAGSLTSFFAGSFNVLLLGRVLQGIGISGPRAISLAIVRDRFEGRAMARIMSFAMTVFILVPMIAPSLGQGVMRVSSWRGIFMALIILAVITQFWYLFRIPESLPPERRKQLTVQVVWSAFLEVVRNRTSLGYTISAGLIGGAFLGYLNLAQQIFVDIYGLGDNFPLIFAVISLGLGFASFVNARIVMRFGMRSLVRWALRIILALSVPALIVALLNDGVPSFWFIMAYLMLTFFSVGILFGNQNSIAMDPLGHLAGMGAAVVGSMSTLIQTPIGTFIGQSYQETVVPLIAGFLLMGLLALLVVIWAER